MTARQAYWEALGASPRLARILVRLNIFSLTMLRALPDREINRLPGIGPSFRAEIELLRSKPFETEAIQDLLAEAGQAFAASDWPRFAKAIWAIESLIPVTISGTSPSANPPSRAPEPGA